MRTCYLKNNFKYLFFYVLKSLYEKDIVIDVLQFNEFCAFQPNNR